MDRRGRNTSRLPRTARRRLLAAIICTAIVAPTAVVVDAVRPEAAAAAQPSAITLTPVADTFVSASSPSANFGTKASLDVFGGTQPFCTPGFTGPNYGLLKFDLSSIPAGAVVTGASLTMTTKAGYAQDGDQNHHVIRLADTGWSENGVTWNTRPADGTLSVGDPTTATGQDIRQSAAALGSTSVFRATCFSGVDLHESVGDQLKQFPTNGFTGNTDQAMSREGAEDNFTAAVADARSSPGALLSLELYTPSYVGLSYWARYYTREAASPALRPRLVLTFASVAVVQAVPNGATTSVSAVVSGTPSTTYALDVASSSSCPAGRLQAPVRLGSVPVTTDATGQAYVTTAFTGSVAFVDAALTSASGELTQASACVAVGPDNDAWTRALPVALTGSGPLTGSASGFLDRQGGARWYRFPVQPGGTVRVDLTNLPADFDLAVFRDIGQAFTALNSTHDLTKLSAEFAPSVFSPSVFSPSVFSPSVFSPDAYSPSVFSPSVFSPSVFSPSVFSPSVFSPSVFSPSVFSPSVFSPSDFSPSVFSPSVFSPSVFSPTGVAPSVFSPETFSSAQTRSLVATSSTAGTADESVVAETWSNTGSFYVRVSGRNGAFATNAPFTLTVTRDDIPACAGVNEIASVPPTVSGTGFQTIVLLDSSRMPASTAGNTATDIAQLRTKLTTFSARSEVQGAVVDLAGDARVRALNVQADAHKGCPYAKNLVAAAIRDVVVAYRNVSPTMRYVVLIGPDGAIPFFRYPDQGLLAPESDYVPPVGSDTPSEASLRLDYVLGQDEYGAADTLALGGDRSPVPDLAVGRLVESATEASGLLDAYTGLAGGVVPTPTAALVTGYDFLADAADSVAADLAAGTGAASGPGQPVNTLIAPNNISPQDPAAWTATTLRAALFGARNDITFLAGHFSANSTLAADFSTSVLSTELASASADFTNAIVFSAGCHSGYNIDDTDAVPNVTAPLDWAQAFARKRATLIAGTGYQYGDTDFIEYSERIYTGFARQLRYGTGPVAVGQALVRAKQAYLRDTPDARGLHRKALVEAALFGLPMLSVDFAQGRLPAPTDTSVVTTTAGFATNPGLTLGLRSADLTVAPALTEHTVPLSVIGGSGPSTLTATYYSGPDGVVVNPAEPALPLVADNVTVSGQVLRGVGFRGGSYTDRAVVPLTGAATTELRGVHSPFVSPVFFPMRLATVNYSDALNGGATRLLVTPAQHRAVDGTDQSTLRRYDNVDVRLFYSNTLTGGALSAAPSLSGVAGTVDGNDVVFSADVTGDPAAGVQQVWVTYTGDAPRWQSIDLAQCVVTPAQPNLPAGCDHEESTHWIGRLVGAAGASSSLRFMAQAVNGVGLVALDDSLGAYYPVTGSGSSVPPVASPTALVLNGVPSSAVYGSSIVASATLTANGLPLAGRSVTFTLGSSGRSGTTDASGVATATVPLAVVPGTTSVRASFAGEAGAYLASSASSPLTVGKSPTALAVAATTPSGPSGPVGAAITLTDATSAPLPSRSVYVTITGAGVVKVVPLITDYLGRATLPPVVLAPGSYNLTATFLGAVPGVAAVVDPTYTGSTVSIAVTVTVGTPPAAVTVGGPASVRAGAVYTATATAQGNPFPAPTYTLSPTPAPPAWLTINSLTGVISGVVPASGVTSFSYRVVAGNSAGSATSATVTVAVTPAADVRIDMVTPGLVTGKPSLYAIVVTNTSTVATAGPLTVTDVLPTGLTYKGFAGPGWSCSIAQRTITCQTAKPLPGRSPTALALVVAVTAPAKSVITNTARVLPLDNNPANNAVTLTTAVVK